MDNLIANEAVKERLIDLQVGLHTAMNALINKKDQKEAEMILRKMDEHLISTIANLKISNR